MREGQETTRRGVSAERAEGQGLQERDERAERSKGQERAGRGECLEGQEGAGRGRREPREGRERGEG